MTQLVSPAIQSKRLVLAIAIVATVVFGPAVLGLVFPERTVEEDMGTSSAFSFGQDARTPDAALDEVEALLDEASSAVPPQFTGEVGLPPGARDTRISNDGMVVGFTVDGEPDAAISSIDEIMEAKGWTAIKLGGIDGKTYVKSDGPYIQVVMTATQVGGSTSVVMRCVRR